MQRNLARMSQQVHDLLVIGGGITGACLARDAALRGLDVALVEKVDFGHATTSASSKLIHGGLRYLRNLEFGLVRESLRERRTWEVIAPHIVHPLKWILPVYRRPRAPGMAKLRMGLTLYDWLAFDRNNLDDDDKKLPAHRALGREAALSLEPTLPQGDLAGALVYYDCQMRAPERLCFEHLLDAVRHGAHVANYAEVVGFELDNHHIRSVEVKDCESGARHHVRGRLVINASGPWADRLLGCVPRLQSSAKIVRSKGIHLVTRALTGEHAVVIEHERGHFFLLPWRGHTLIGTTDAPYLGDPDEFAVTEADIHGFLDVINAGYPAAELERSDVLYAYGGLRPLVEGGEVVDDGTYAASRRSEIYDHALGDGVDNLVSALGGKWTTSRHLAEQLMTIVEHKLERSLPLCETATAPLPGGEFATFRGFIAAKRRTHPGLEAEIVDHLAGDYGSLFEDVVELGRDHPELLTRVADPLPCIAAEVVHAVRGEMALRLADVVLRRTGLGTLGHPGAAALARAADLMAGELGWERARVRDEITDVERHYRHANGALS